MPQEILYSRTSSEAGLGVHWTSTVPPDSASVAVTPDGAAGAAAVPGVAVRQAPPEPHPVLKCERAPSNPRLSTEVTA